MGGGSRGQNDLSEAEGHQGLLVGPEAERGLGTLSPRSFRACLPC